tara:strand:+ start:117 stop:845 length:729 start_codon:yes stop_codon:yes gene_type:complete
MIKKFDIHEWQAKQRLAEQDEFIPDLEDDELKRGAIQQMMDKEKPQTPQDVPQGTLNNAIADLAAMYSYGEILDSLKVFYTDNDEIQFADMAKKHAKEFRDFLGPDVDSPSDEEMFMGDWGPHLAEGDDEELDEQNVTGTGASFNAGDGAGYSTPNAFAKKGKWKNKNMVFEEEESEEEPEEELEKDVEKISNLPVLDKVNTKPEWEDMMQVAWDMADDIKTVNDSHKKQWLQTALKSFNKI